MKTKILSLFTLLLLSTFCPFGKMTLLTEGRETMGEGESFISNASHSCSSFFSLVSSKPPCFKGAVSNVNGNLPSPIESLYMDSKNIKDRIVDLGQNATNTACHKNYTRWLVQDASLI